MFALVDVNNFYALRATVGAATQPAGRRPEQQRRLCRCSQQGGQGHWRAHGRPWFKLREQAKQHRIIALSSNYELYASMSNRVVDVLRDLPGVGGLQHRQPFSSLDGMSGASARATRGLWAANPAADCPVGRAAGLRGRWALQNVCCSTTWPKHVFSGVRYHRAEPGRAGPLDGQAMRGEVWGGTAHQQAAGHHGHQHRARP